MQLSEAIRVSDRLAKSANVERDSGRSLFSEYHLTGRGIDVLSQIARGLAEPSAGRAFSITGPYGSGKSSFAVFLEALFDDVKSSRYLAAVEHVRLVDETLADRWASARNAFASDAETPIRAFVTAQREPLVYTLARALHLGVNKRADYASLVPASFANPEISAVSASEVRQVAMAVSRVAPLVILVDEFGKNLEAFSESGAAGDPFLLQEFAEAAQGEEAAPIVLVTMQHLAFDEYVGDAGTARRREWAKVQGRFHDIGFVESAQQTRELIAAAFIWRADAVTQEVTKWYKKSGRAYATASLTISESAQRSYPLHPVVLEVLPELCTRYGQNERTLYSFLAGADSASLPAALERMVFEPGTKLPFIGLDVVYDYFLEAASSFVGASAYAARWLEIETRIRDTLGLSTLEVQVLKSIGILNLVSSGGAVRASRSILQIAIEDSLGIEQGAELSKVLSVLESRGLVTYREFADEFRIWNGSDFDIRSAIENGRAAASQKSPSERLRSQVSLGPVIAGKHSQRTGMLRVFPRILLNPSEFETFAFSPGVDAVDGYVVLAPTEGLAIPADFAPDVPVVIGRASDDKVLVSLATEALAIISAIDDVNSATRDWVAKSELSERLASVELALKNEAELQWHPATAAWEVIGSDGLRHQLDSQKNLSSLLSIVSDLYYSASPQVANEMIARRELTSQGAKARRMVAERIFASPQDEKLGISGYGPERAIYEAILRDTGIHRKENDGSGWAIGEPSDPLWATAWNSLDALIAGSSHERVSLDKLTQHLALPPFGLKQGVVSVLLLSVLQSRIEDIALYEYGNLVLAVDDAVVERVLKNPSAFAARNVGGSHGARRQLVIAISERLSIGGKSKPGFLQVARALFRQVRSLEPYSQTTTNELAESSVKVRMAFREAVEPDILLFESIPKILGHAPIGASLKTHDMGKFNAIANDLTDVLLQLGDAYPALLRRLTRKFSDDFSASDGLAALREDLVLRSNQVDLASLEPEIRALVTAFQRQHLEDKPWLENLSMVVIGGVAPRSWTDESEVKFDIRLHELSRRFRRLEALWFGQSAASDPQSRRLTLTWPNGDEFSEVVRNDGRYPKKMFEILEPTVDFLAKSLGGDRAARIQIATWLLASLNSEEELSETPALGVVNE